ncbi:MAG: isopentenyl phosphate kinase [Promethearchaeota archaeon]
MTSYHTPKIIIVKLGGSLITDKSQPLSVNSEILQNLSNQISQFYSETDHSLIIVHGGGSFGHPIAEKFQIQQGYNPAIKDQIEGLIQTHSSMEELNQICTNALAKVGIHTYPIAPSTVFLKKEEDLIFNGRDIIVELLNHRIIPVLYGDILFVQPSNFQILSGDAIITELCQTFGPDSILKVVFTTDEDGIYQKNSSNDDFNLITQITAKEFLNINFESFNEDPAISDVTGGMRGKFNEIQNIVQLGICVEILNGQSPNLLYQALKNQAKKSTIIKPT